MFFIISLTNHTIARKKIEQIAYEKIRCLTKEELFIKRLVNSLNYLFNNINQEFDEETFTNFVDVVIIRKRYEL